MASAVDKVSPCDECNRLALNECTRTGRVLNISSKIKGIEIEFIFIKIIE